MVSEWKSTGEILPRAYGLRVFNPGSRSVFVNPAAYLIGQMMLESPAEISLRISDWAERNGISREKARKDLEEAVRNREKSLNVLSFSRRTADRRTDLVLSDVEAFGDRYDLTVKSKSNGDHYVQIPYPRARRINVGFPGSTSTSQDHRWSGVKGDMSHIGIHIAVAEVALLTDQGSRLNMDDNLTGLSPSDLTYMGETKLPFTFNFFKKRMSRAEQERHSAVTDLLFDYYLNGKSQYELAISALENRSFYSNELVKGITHPKDLARFVVIRQDEEKRKRENLSSTEDRHYGSVNALIENISEYIQERDYKPAGYSREFVGTPFENVARRFVSTGYGPIYHLVLIGDDGKKVPALVRKYLDHRTRNFVNAHETGDISNLLPVARIGKTYDSVDDSTRRVQRAEVVFPDNQKFSHLVPLNLRDIYRNWRKLYSSA